MEDGRRGSLVRVAPPVVSQPYGLGDKDIEQLILLPRYREDQLDQVDRPTPVLIYRILDPSKNRPEAVHNSNITLAAWGEVYPTLQEAERAADSSSL